MSVNGKTILVTGSTDGVGHYVAQALADEGARVLVHGRDAKRGNRLVERIRASGGQAQFYAADFASLTAVRSLAAAISHDHARLDVLVNNAGIGVGGRGATREVSVDGYELRFAVNYLSGFLLTHLLLPLLNQAPEARVVTVTSIGQQAIDFDNVMLRSGYSGTRAYCQSKLAQIMFTLDLAQLFEGSGRTANCIHPASYMDTTMVRKDGIAPLSTVEEGGHAILALISGGALAGRSGLYFEGLHRAKPNASALDLDARARLRRLSGELTGLGSAL